MKPFILDNFILLELTYNVTPFMNNFNSFTFNLQGQLWQIDCPQIMGVLNVTPDSFYDGGRYQSDETILSQCAKMVEEGVDLVDVGGYSSRPNADNISIELEKERVQKALQVITKNFPNLIISVDTFRSEVARMAIGEGAHIINDISGGQLDAEMFRTVAELKVPYILMHMKGTPQTMKSLAQYDNILHNLLDYFANKINTLKSLGVKDIVIDPGFGFAKTIDQNFELFNQIEQLHHLELPLLIGVSRKSMIWKTLDVEPNEALNGTTALNTIALQKGAHFLRVHDVKEAKEVLTLLDKLNA